MGKKLEEITSVEDAIKVIKNLKRDKNFIDEKISYSDKHLFEIWFRGHSKKDYKLEPTIFRPKSEIDGKKNYYNETSIFTLSSLRLPEYKDKYKSNFDWLCLLQHYDVPTRLLDWTESILVALYFAVKSNKDADGELIVLNARSLNQETRQNSNSYICIPESFDSIVRANMAYFRISSEFRKSFNARINENFFKPIAVYPYRWNSRMVSQSSLFTIHGGKFYSKEEERYLQEDRKSLEDKIKKPISLDEINKNLKKKKKRPIIKKYLIPKKSKESIKETLLELGIHEGTLFPEMDHQAVYLKELW